MPGGDHALVAIHRHHALHHASQDGEHLVAILGDRLHAIAERAGHRVEGASQHADLVLGVRLDPASEVSHERRDHEEPEPGATAAPDPLARDAVEALKHAFEIFGPDTDAPVGDLDEEDLGIGSAGLQDDVDRLVRVLHRVVDEVSDDHHERRAVGIDDEVRVDLYTDGLVVEPVPRLDRLQGGVLYRLPPPGAAMVDGRLEANSAFPGLQIRYTSDGSEPTGRRRI